MAYRNLDEFLIRLEQANELVHITQTVSPDLEIAAIADRYTSSSQNKALWFDSVDGSPFPVVANLFGTEKRLAWALGIEKLADIKQRLEKLLDFKPPFSLSTLMSRAGELVSVARSAASGLYPNAPVQQVQITDSPDIRILPILRSWQHEPYPTITLAQIITQNIVTKKRTIQPGRVVIYDSQTLGITAHPVYQSTSHHSSALVLGSDPAVIWSMNIPLPANLDPLWLAGWLRGKPVPLARAITQDIVVPADADMVIEGWIDTADIRPYGPFAWYDGYYTPTESFVTFHVTAITHRSSAIYPASIVTARPAEYHWIHTAAEQLFMPLLRLLMEEVIEIHLPAEGTFYNLAVARIQSSYLGQAKKVIFGLWGLGEFAFNRTLIIVDENVNPQDPHAVIEAIVANVDWQQDIVLTNGLAQRLNQVSGKLGIDATRKPVQNPPTPVPILSESVVDSLVGSQWELWNNRILIAAIGTQAAAHAEVISALVEICPQVHMVLVSNMLDLQDKSAVVRHVLSNVNWTTDLFIENGRVVLNVTRSKQPLQEKTR